MGHFVCKLGFSATSYFFVVIVRKTQLRESCRGYSLSNIGHTDILDACHQDPSGHIQFNDTCQQPKTTLLIRHNATVMGASLQLLSIRPQYKGQNQTA